MIIETVKLNEMSVFTEFFLGLSILYLVIHGLFVTFSSSNNFPLIQSSLINLSILILLMCCFLLYNDSLIIVKYTSFCNTIINDYLTFIGKMIVVLSSIICLLLIKQYLIIQKINSFEYIVLVLFAVLGLLLLCSANDFITVYLAIELQSLSFYILAAFKKTSFYSIDSGLKYFILGSFSSSLFLFGTSLIYGILGTINFTDLKDLMIQGNSKNYSMVLFDYRLISSYVYDFLNNNAIDHYYFTSSYYINSITIGLFFVFTSLFFKLALAPFHLWSLDIYENSPTSSAFFFAVVPKISIFIVVIRFSYYALFDIFSWSQEIIAIIALLSIIVGSLGGIEQRKLKSLLAYSSISHIGYVMISFASESYQGISILISYLIVYTISGLCLWSVVILVRLKNLEKIKQNKDLADFVLLKKSNFMLAIILMFALFSIAGLPPLIGFLVKFNIFLVTIQKTMYFVAFLSMLFSAISTFFYLRIIKILFFEPVLVGKLYHPIICKKSVLVLIILCYFFLFLFVNPTLLNLVSYKISLLFQ